MREPALEMVSSRRWGAQLMAKVVQLHGRTKRTFKVGFLPLEQFTLIALSSAIEPLRMANHLTGEALYDWQLIRPAIAPVTASGGTSMLPNACLNDVGDLDLIDRKSVV